MFFSVWRVAVQRRVECRRDRVPRSNPVGAVFASGIAQQKVYRTGGKKTLGRIIEKAMCGSDKFVRPDHSGRTSVRRRIADLSDGGPWIDVNVLDFGSKGILK